MTGNEIGDRGVRHISDALRENSTLLDVNLDSESFSFLSWILFFLIFISSRSVGIVRVILFCAMCK